MADTFFETYQEAASYAKLWAQKSGLPVKLERRNQEWVVYTPALPQQRVSPSDVLPTMPPTYDDCLGLSNGIRREEVMAQEALEREQRQQEYAAQKAYERTIREHTPRIKEAKCEACDRPISFCRCGG